MRTITLTPNYRITSDGDRNFSLEQRITVDPTKAPGWAAKVTEAAASGKVLDTKSREEWRVCGSYYSFTAGGLTAMLSNVAIRVAWEKDASGESLVEFAADITNAHRDLSDAVKGLFQEVAG